MIHNVFKTLSVVTCAQTKSTSSAPMMARQFEALPNDRVQFMNEGGAYSGLR